MIPTVRLIRPRLALSRPTSLRWSTNSSRIPKTAPTPTPSPPSSIRRYNIPLSITAILLSASLGFILSSTLTSHDLPLIPSLTSRFFTPADDFDESKPQTGKGPGTNHPHHGSPRAYAAAIVALQKWAEENDRVKDVSTDEADLYTHGVSEWSYHEAEKPTVVVWAKGTQDISDVVKIANKVSSKEFERLLPDLTSWSHLSQYKVPITMFSGGTSLEGHFSSPYGGISLDVSRMDKILKFRGEWEDHGWNLT